MLHVSDDQALQRHPELARALDLLAAGKPIKALECAQRFATLHPDKAVGHIVESDIAELARCHAVAVAACKRATELAPGRHDLYLRGIRSALQIGDELSANRFFAAATPISMETGQGLEDLWDLFVRASHVFQPPVQLKAKLPMLPATPLVSVVVPVGADQRWVEPAVSSVLAQRYRNWEAIVVNVGGKPLHLSSNDRRIHLVDGSPASTIAEARNQGIELARGHLICSLSEHSVFKPMHLACAVSGTRNRTVIGVFANSDRRTDGHDDQCSSGSSQRTSCHRPFSPLTLQLHDYVHVDEVVLRRDHAGALRFDPALGCCAEWDYLQNAFALGPLGRLNESTSEIRMVTTSGLPRPTPANCAQLFERHPPSRAWITFGRQLFTRRLRPV